MSKEIVLKPEIELIKTDEFYLFYEMMMQSLKTDNVVEGINNSLSMFKTFLKCGNIILYKKNEDGIYIFKTSDSKVGKIGKLTSYFVNKTKTLVKQKEIINFDNISCGELNNILLLHIRVGNEKIIAFLQF